MFQNYKGKRKLESIAEALSQAASFEAGAPEVSAGAEGEDQEIILIKQGDEVALAFGFHDQFLNAAG